MYYYNFKRPIIKKKREMEEPQQEKVYSFNKSFSSHYSLRKSLVIRGILSSTILYLKYDNLF